VIQYRLVKALKPEFRPPPKRITHFFVDRYSFGGCLAGFIGDYDVDGRLHCHTCEFPIVCGGTGYLKRVTVPDDLMLGA